MIKLTLKKMYHYNNLTDNEINWENITFPANNNTITQFEEQNNISVNVYEEFIGFEDDNGNKSIILNRRTQLPNPKLHVDLLRVSNHYVIIKDYDKLMSSQTNKHKEKCYHCRYCQHGFSKENLLKQHYEKKDALE